MKIPIGLHIIQFAGGLGNQMFEYAFYLSLREKCPLAFYGFDTYAAEVEHYGYELDNIFCLDTHRERNRHAFIRKLERHHYVQFTEIKEGNAIVYTPDVYENVWQPHVYKGYWQSEKYFLPVIQDVRKAFRFREDKLSEKTKIFARQLQESSDTISLHVRRGDYISIGDTKTFGNEYYNEALRVANAHGEGRLVVFSDDMQWAKVNLHYENMMFVDWNIGKNSWQDMYLMSLCKNNIIANSTFSWWGAWLNANPDKIVIAPKKWMTWEPENSNIIPDTWIRL